MKEHVMRIIKLLAAAVAITTLAGTVSAHPKLVSAVPAANATVASPKHIDLHFSEQLMPAFSKGDLVMAAMPGMGAMKMASSVSVGADGKTLVITPKAMLPKGKYAIDWRVVSKDTHKLAGHYAFSVR